MTDASEWSGATVALTPLQRDLLVLVVNGLTNRQIAERLGLSPGLIGTHIGRITRELGARRYAELAAMRTADG
jgi:DNA-binding CsgD family transcriptional regulator